MYGVPVLCRDRLAFVLPCAALVALVASACGTAKKPLETPDATDITEPIDAQVAPEIVDASPTDATSEALEATADAPIDAPAEASRAKRVDAAVEPEEVTPPADECLEGMVKIDAFCIDAYEAYVVVLGANGKEFPHSPYQTVDGLSIRAKVAANVIPQAYISQIQSAKACRNAGKRLCRKAEFEKACTGPEKKDFYPYGGRKKEKGYCNEGHGSMVPKYYGMDVQKWTYGNFNDPRLNKEGNLAKTGAFKKCGSPYGVFDLVGNLHEWGSDPPDGRGRGRFRGGFYGDAEINGPGCHYVTSAHEPTYHDYSTGFRCCMDVTADP